MDICSIPEERPPAIFQYKCTDSRSPQSDEHNPNKCCWTANQKGTEDWKPHDNHILLTNMPKYKQIIDSVFLNEDAMDELLKDMTLSEYEATKKTHQLLIPENITVITELLNLAGLLEANEAANNDPFNFEENDAPSADDAYMLQYVEAINAGNIDNIRKLYIGLKHCKDKERQQELEKRMRAENKTMMEGSTQKGGGLEEACEIPFLLPFCGIAGFVVGVGVVGVAILVAVGYFVGMIVKGLMDGGLNLAVLVVDACTLTVVIADDVNDWENEGNEIWTYGNNRSDEKQMTRSELELRKLKPLQFLIECGKALESLAEESMYTGTTFEFEFVSKKTLAKRKTSLDDIIACWRFAYKKYEEGHKSMLGESDNQIIQRKQLKTVQRYAKHTSRFTRRFKIIKNRLAIHAMLNDIMNEIQYQDEGMILKPEDAAAAQEGRWPVERNETKMTVDWNKMFSEEKKEAVNSMLVDMETSIISGKDNADNPIISWLNMQRTHQPTQSEYPRSGHSIKESQAGGKSTTSRNRCKYKITKKKRGGKTKRRRKTKGARKRKNMRTNRSISYK